MWHALAIAEAGCACGHHTPHPNRSLIYQCIFLPHTVHLCMQPDRPTDPCRCYARKYISTGSGLPLPIVGHTHTYDELAVALLLLHHAVGSRCNIWLLQVVVDSSMFARCTTPHLQHVLHSGCGSGASLEARPSVLFVWAADNTVVHADKRNVCPAC